MRNCLPDDTGGIVVGWLVKLVAVFAVIGVLAFDGMSFGVAELAITDTAAAASREASSALTGGGTAQQAYDAARAAAITDHGLNDVPVEAFVVGADGSVTLTVRRSTPTLVLHHVPGSERWLVAESTSSHAAG